MVTSDSQTMTEYLPQVRCTPEMKAALEAIAANSVARNISDHIRYALEGYIAKSTTDPPSHPCADSMAAGEKE